jgi:signal transduction histidine kinase/CheY-like chemotaxis protein/integral membrane sensor domain MASE1
MNRAIKIHPPLMQRPHTWQDFGMAIALGAIYASLIAFTTLFWRADAPLPIWAADGLAAAIIALSRPSARGGMLAAVFIANFGMAIGYEGTIIAASGGAIANVLEVLLAVVAMHRIVWKKTRAMSLRLLLTFVVSISILTTGLAALLQAIVGMLLSARPFQADFFAIWISNALGMTLIMPLVIIWGMAQQDIHAGRLPPLPWRPRRMVEGTAVFVLIVFTSWFVFSAEYQSSEVLRPHVYMCLPGLLWVALRFGWRYVTASVVIVAMFAIFYTAQGLGQFAADVSIGRALLELQVFLIVQTLAVFMIATLRIESELSADHLRGVIRRTGAVLRASGSVVFEIDVASKRIQWVGDTQRVLGWSANDICTTALWNEKVHPDDQERLTGVREKLASGDESSVKLEYRIYRADGNETMLGVGAYGSTFFDVSTRRNRRVIVGLVKDMTDVVALAAKNRQLDASLRQSQKMESIGLLAGGIAHDFNNILAAILGYAEMAQSKLVNATETEMVRDHPRLTHYVETILQAAERGRLLVAQVLTFSRRSPEQQSLVDIAALVSEAVQLLRGSFKFQIVMDLENRDSHVQGDATALHQLVMNICTNGLQAISATESSGHKRGVLSILLTRQQITADDAARIMGELEAVSSQTTFSRLPEPGDYAVIRIVDDGIGMTAETRARMFDPFFTTKSVGSGTGLGLSLAMSIAHAHGGCISCQSAIGQGTSFSVYLPQGVASVPELLVTTPIARMGQGERIMLVDDEAPLRQLGEELLTNLGYVPVVYASSEEAWQAFQAAPASFAAVLTDEVMPGMTGTQLAGMIHAASPDTPILVITAYGGAGFHLRAEEVGVRRILKKPYRREDIAQALGEALGR